MEKEMGIVRLQEIAIENFKNVGKGIANFQSYRNIKKMEPEDGADILGIYGQNGSGKTALVECLDILKSVMAGEVIQPEMVNLLACNKENTKLRYTLKVNIDDKKYLVDYSFVIKVVENTNPSRKENIYAQIISEDLKYSELRQDKKQAKKNIVNYDISNNKNDLFRPKEIYKEIISADEENSTKLFLSSEFAKENGTSFIFSDRTIDVLEKNYNKESIYTKIIVNLRHFARIDLFVIKNNYLGHINLNTLMPFSFMLKDNISITKGMVSVPLFESSMIPEKSYKLLERVKDEINIVLKSIIPGLTIEVNTIKEALTKEGEVGRNIELTSKRGDVEIPLKYESEGIKKIISILSALIAMYNNENVCVVVDELDAGIFEFLLGELLEIFKGYAKGQLIFTSHNLRPLEVLDKNDIIFTTMNPNNRYIKLKYVRESNNLRDFYLRGIFLGGQDEIIYQKTKSYDINRSFRKAGIMYEE